MPERGCHRWVSFDCYGTLIDWRAGMTEAFRTVVGEQARELLDAYHRNEHVVQADEFSRSQAG